MDQLTRYANRDARLRKVEEDKAKILLAPLLAEKDAQIAVLQKKLEANGGDPELVAKREEELKFAVERVKQLEAENADLKKALEEATAPAPEATPEAANAEAPAPEAAAPAADATAPAAEAAPEGEKKPQGKKKGK